MFLMFTSKFFVFCFLARTTLSGNVLNEIQCVLFFFIVWSDLKFSLQKKKNVKSEWGKKSIFFFFKSRIPYFLTTNEKKT